MTAPHHQPRSKGRQIRLSKAKRRVLELTTIPSQS
jgi:hypothetical protein